MVACRDVNAEQLEAGLEDLGILRTYRRMNFESACSRISSTPDDHHTEYSSS